MKKYLVFFLVLLIPSAYAQSNEIHDAWLFLKDKPKAAIFLANPISMVSQRAIDRRSTQSIPFDEKDVPIDLDYYTTIKNTPNVSVLGASKWLNAVHVQATLSVLNELPTRISFIDRVAFADKTVNSLQKRTSEKIIENHLNKFTKIKSDFNYGAASNQITMLKGDALHQQGLTGHNQIIAVIDAGFPNVDKLDAFKRIRDNNQILGGYNFADRNDNFYTRNSHGTLVLSTIAGYLENEFVGTAPDANFYLFITEIAESETVLEETLWVEAAERADSLGVDVLNTSLGYTTFDNPKHNYSYNDMDGKTTFISRGAEIASSRGMLVVNSAGNSGTSAWKYIGAPADAVSVISVGAVDASKNIASFSSFGPSFDGRIKPEIVAQGLNSSLINHVSGNITTASGTSFSGPIMAGLIACLNGYGPLFVKSKRKSKIQQNFNDYLKEAVFKSADRFQNPDDRFGYGIPDFEQAFNDYANSLSVEESILEKSVIFPNPVVSTFVINNLQDSIKQYQLQLFDVLGKQVDFLLENEAIDISQLQKGMYFLRVIKGNQSKTLKILKD